MVSISVAKRLHQLEAPAIVAGWVLLCLILYWIAQSGLHSRPAEGHPADFAIFRTAAEIIKKGKTEQLYNIETQRLVFYEVTQNRYRKFMPWNHHPAEAFLYLPASILSYETGLRVAKWFNIVLMVALMSFVASRLGSIKHSILLLASIMYLNAPFFTSAIAMGQDSVWLLALLILGLEAAATGKRGFACVLLGMASIKFTILLPLIAIFIIALPGYRKLAALVLMVASGIAVLAGVLLGVTSSLEYGRLLVQLLPMDGQMGLYSQFLCNFRGIINGYIHDHAVVMSITFISGLMFAVACRQVPQQRVPGYALLGATFFSPHVYPHDGVMYAGGMIVLLLSAQQKAKIFETHIDYSGRTYEEGKKINWKDGMKAIWAILQFGLSRDVDR